MIPGQRLFARQHEARLRRLLPKALREDLVDGDACPDAGALLNGNAGENRDCCRTLRGELMSYTKPDCVFTGTTKLWAT